jgi:hypothetical protein
MKEKKYKYVEDVMEDYLQLIDEQIEIPLTIAQAREKQISLMDDVTGNVLKKGDAEDVFKVFMQLKKTEERKAEIQMELTELEDLLKEFLHYINGNKLSYERKDELDKQKVTYLFWLEEGVIKCNR